MSVAFFSKANENLRAAQLCFEQGLYNACANRIYYASLHAAIAALAAKGFTRERIDHEWVQAEFSNRLVNREKVYPAKFKSYLRDMQAFRNIADYTSEDVSKIKASRWLEKGQEFISTIAKECQL